MKSPLVSRRNQHPQQFGREGIVNLNPWVFRVVHGSKFCLRKPLNATQLI